jgi:hypothetical protein
MGDSHDPVAAASGSLSVGQFAAALPSGPRPRYTSSATPHFSALATGVALNTTARLSVCARSTVASVVARPQ